MVHKIANKVVVGIIVLWCRNQTKTAMCLLFQTNKYCGKRFDLPYSIALRHVIGSPKRALFGCWSNIFSWKIITNLMLYDGHQYYTPLNAIKKVSTSLGRF